MIHYAGDLSKQVSTVDFVESEFFSIRHYLFVSGGPLASGAGIFDRNRYLIATNIYRTLENYALSREVLLLTHSNLFNPTPPFSIYPGNSIVRPYVPTTLTNYVMTFPAYSVPKIEKPMISYFTYRNSITKSLYPSKTLTSQATVELA